MNIINSIKSRKNGFVFNNYQNSKYSKKMKTLKNKYKGKRCFIIGNGPSLTLDDLNLLHEKGEYTFGMNRIFKLFDLTAWRPTFYCCEDINIFNDSIDKINSINSQYKFIPVNYHLFDGINIENAYYFKPCYGLGGFSDDISIHIESAGTVTFVCMQIAAYMGFSEIYLLGIDHNYHIIIDEDGNTVVDENAKDYFCDDYDKDIIDNVQHDMGKNTRTYRRAVAASETMSFKIFNSTRGGKLEVFPRVDFDSLFEEVEK